MDSSGNYGAAIDALSKAIELYPQLAAAYYNRGNTNWELAKHDQAINDYNKAIDIDHEVRIQWFAAI